MSSTLLTYVLLEMVARIFMLNNCIRCAVIVASVDEFNCKGEMSEGKGTVEVDIKAETIKYIVMHAVQVVKA